jgi:hypothetical protein
MQSRAGRAFSEGMRANEAIVAADKHAARVAARPAAFVTWRKKKKMSGAAWDLAGAWL